MVEVKVLRILKRGVLAVLCGSSLLLAFAPPLSRGAPAVSPLPGKGASLPAPQWVYLLAREGKVGLRWVDSTSYAAVRILRRTGGGSGPFAAIAEAGDNSFVDGKVEGGMTYHYQLIGIAP